jgi:hypothetical protein
MSCARNCNNCFYKEEDPEVYEIVKHKINDPDACTRLMLLLGIRKEQKKDG